MNATRIWNALLVGLTLWTPLAGQAQEGGFQAPLDCVIEPQATVKVGSAEQGILAEVLVARGDHVSKGEPLARLDMELERLGAELAKLHAEEDVEVRSRQSQLSYRKAENARFRELREKQAVPATELDKANVETRLALLSVEAARADRRMAEVEYQRAVERLERRTIRSPVDGVVVEVLMAPGEYVHEQAQLMTVAAMDPLHVEVFVPVAHYGRITKGMSATVSPEPPVGGTYRAKVAVVDQVFDPASRTFGVRLLLPNPETRLPAGLRCTVQFEEPKGDALTSAGPR